MNAIEIEELFCAAALATKETTWRAAARIALAMGYEDKGREVQRWGEAFETPGPVARCARFLLAASELQHDPARRYQAIHWLCELLGGRFVEPREKQGSLPDLVASMTQSVGSYGEVCTEFSEGYRDGRFDEQELADFLAATRTHRSKIHQMEEQVRRDTKGLDSQLEAVS